MTRSTMFIALLLAGALGASGTAAAQASGELDRHFGEESGLTATALRDPSNGKDVAGMPDGGWVTSGIINPAPQGKLPGKRIPTLTRYRADGTRDTTFGDAGTVTVPALAATDLDAGAVLADASRVYLIVSDDSHLRVLAYTHAGQPDLAYGNGGVATVAAVPANVIAYVYPVIEAVLQNGRVLIAASGRADASAPGLQFLLARLTASGQADASLGAGGKRYYQVHAGIGARNILTGVTLQPDGKIVAAGRARAVGGDYDMVVGRFDANGNPDGGFGSSSGFRIFSLTDIDYGRRVAVQNDGKIVVAGTVCAWVDRSAEESTCFLGAARLRSNGDLDAGFGAGGKVILPVSGSSEDAETSVYALATDPQRRTIIAGQMAGVLDATNEAYVTRLAENGTLDTTFGYYGVVSNPYRGETASYVSAVTLTQVPDGVGGTQPRLITVGTRSPASGDAEMVIGRHVYDNGDVARGR